MFPSSANKVCKNNDSDFNKKRYERFETTNVEYDKLNYTESSNENEIDEIDEMENEEFYKYINEGLDEESETDSLVSTFHKNSTFFNYSALDFLMKDEIPFFENVNICAFYVNQTAKYPFLQFLFNKYPPGLLDDILCLPSFSCGNQSSILDECFMKLDRLVGSYKSEDDDKYKYKGYLVEDNELYLFFDLSSLDIQVQELYRREPAWFVIVDEIINYESVCNFKIYSGSSNFFKKNKEFYKLYDENESLIEMPVVCYSGIEEKKLKFTGIFGIGKSDNNHIVGPYYYFTSYSKSIKQCELFSESEKCGIVRFALFLGKLKVPLNYPSEKNDESDYKKKVIEDACADKDAKTTNDFQKNTLKISDYDGTWTDEYDSVYIGKLELLNGKTLEEAPYWVVKEYEQQMPLSYHYIDKRSIENFMGEETKCYIK
jgi:hypothetical protein